MSNAVIFNGEYVKSLKSKIKLGESAHIETGSADPSTLSISAPLGSLYLRSNGTLYVKFGSNVSDWAPTALSNVGGTLQNTALLDSSVYFINNTDNSKKLYFELSSITPGVSRTLTIPNVNGTIALGSGATGQVAYWDGNVLTGEAQLSSSRGGTGVNNAGTLTYGSNNVTLTTTASTNVALPTSGTLATLAGSENLSNKTINSSSIGATSPSSGAFTFLSIQGSGVAGTAYFDFKQETSTPSSPSSGLARVFFTTDVLNIINNIGEVFSLNYSNITTNRSLSVPDRTSTIVTLDGDQTFTGNIAVDSAGSIRFNELSTNGTNYVALKGPSSIASDVILTLPNTAGTNGQYLSTNGTGTLSWASVPLATASQDGLVSTTTQTFAGTKTFSAVSSGGYGLTSSAINAQGGSYILQSSDNGKIITINNGGATTVTVPAGLGLGFNCSVIQIGSGQVTIGASGTTLNSSSGFKIAAQHGAVSIISYATDVYNVSGNTAV